MKFAVATLLVIASLASAEPPRFEPNNRQTAPYQPSGWRPSGPSFELPQSQQNYVPPQPQVQQAYGAPIQSYGRPNTQYAPPESELSVETTTASDENITKPPSKLVENIKGIDKKPEKLQDEQKQQNPVFFIIPQPEKLVYAVQPSAGFVAIPQAKILANLQGIPVSLPAVSTSIYTPTYSSSYVQFYQ